MRRRKLLTKRTPVWDRANKDYHATHKLCEMCGLPAGHLGKLDGTPGTQEAIENHDKLPYHKLSEAQKNDYDFIMGNLIALHSFEHKHIAHGGDPNCYKYNPDIAEVAALVLVARKDLVK